MIWFLSFFAVVLSVQTLPAEQFLDAALTTYNSAEIKPLFATGLSYKEGFIPRGDVFGTPETMTLQQAKQKCTRAPKCKGFTFNNADGQTTAQVFIEFKTKTDVAYAPNWHSWVKSGEVNMQSPLPYSAAILYILRNLRLAFSSVEKNSKIISNIIRLETRIHDASMQHKQHHNQLDKLKKTFSFVKGIVENAESVNLQNRINQNPNTYKVPVHPLKEGGTGYNFIYQSMPVTKDVQLADGNSMPRLGFGTWMLQGRECYQAVKWALEAGYRHIDTAQGYYNEAEVGRAVRDSGVPRSEIFVASKISKGDADYARGRTREVVLKSLKDMGLEYFDLYAIHGPIGNKKKLDGAWKDLEDLKDEGKIKSLGVSNYEWHYLRLNFEMARHRPVYLQNKYDIYSHGVQTQDENSIYWYAKENKIEVMGYSSGNMWPGKLSARDDVHIKAIAGRHGKTPSQVIHRWALQCGINLIPRSSKKEHIIENFGVWDFELTEDELQQINGILHMVAYVPISYMHDYYGLAIKEQRDEL